MSVPEPYALRNGDWSPDPSWQNTADLAEFHAGRAIEAISLMNHYLQHLRVDEDVNAYMRAQELQEKVCRELDAVPESEAFSLRRQVAKLVQQIEAI